MAVRRASEHAVRHERTYSRFCLLADPDLKQRLIQHIRLAIRGGGGGPFFARLATLAMCVSGVMWACPKGKNSFISKTVSDRVSEALKDTDAAWGGYMVLELLWARTGAGGRERRGGPSVRQGALSSGCAAWSTQF